MLVGGRIEVLMMCTKGLGGRRMNVALNGELLKKVESFKCLGSKSAVDVEKCWEE